MSRLSPRQGPALNVSRQVLKRLLEQRWIRVGSSGFESRDSMLVFQTRVARMRDDGELLRAGRSGSDAQTENTQRHEEAVSIDSPRQGQTSARRHQSLGGATFEEASA